MEEIWNDINGEPLKEPMAKCDADEAEMFYMEMVRCKICKQWKTDCKCKKPKFYGTG